MKKFTLLFPVILFSLGLFAQQREYTVQGPLKSNDKQIVKENKVSRLVSNSESKSKGFIYFEGFETSPDPSNGALPEGWIQKRTATLDAEPTTDAVDPMWFRQSSEYGFDEPEYVRSGEGSLAIGYTAEDFTWAIGPEFAIPTSGGNPLYLEFWTWYVNVGGSGPYPTNYYVKVKADGTWHTAHSQIGTPVETTNNVWDMAILVEMDAYAGKTVQIAFVYEYTDGYQMAIDDVSVYEIPNNDFVLENVYFGPYFAVTPDSTITFNATVRCNGLTEGQPTVYLKVNGVDESSIQVSTDLFYGDTEDIELTFSPSGAGKFIFDLYLAEDEIVENNSFQDSVDVYEAVTFEEDFENIDWTDPEEPVVIFPPTGWEQTENERDWDWTSDYAIDQLISARCYQQLDDPEARFITPKITFAEATKGRRPTTLAFWTAGLNNALTYESNLLGHSTMVVKYSTDNIIWTDLYTFAWDDPAKNSAIYHEIDISGLAVGDYYFAFATTSTFELTANGTTYYSHAIIDNVLIYEEGGTSVVTPSLTSINAYPNPFSNYIEIANPTQVNRVVVTNLLGQSILDVRTNGAQRVETASLPTGLYLVTFEANNGEKVVHKMVKK